MPPDRDTTRLHVTYRISCADGEDPAAKARDIAYEQTVELPADSVSPAVVARSVGRVETLEPAGDGRWRAVISFDAGLVGAGDVPQLLNLLFGNISLKAGIELPGLQRARASRSQASGARRRRSPGVRRPRAERGAGACSWPGCSWAPMRSDASPRRATWPSWPPRRSPVFFFMTATGSRPRCCWASCFGSWAATP